MFKNMQTKNGIQISQFSPNKKKYMWIASSYMWIAVSLKTHGWNKIF